MDGKLDGEQLISINFTGNLEKLSRYLFLLLRRNDRTADPTTSTDLQLILN